MAVGREDQLSGLPDPPWGWEGGNEGGVVVAQRHWDGTRTLQEKNCKGTALSLRNCTATESCGSGGIVQDEVYCVDGTAAATESAAFSAADDAMRHKGTSETRVTPCNI